MSGHALLVRLDAAPGALERLIGLLRRRRFPVARMTLSFTDDDAIEVILRPRQDAEAERLRAELDGLADVVHTEVLEGPRSRMTRAVALAWIRPDAAVRATPAGRIIAVTDAGCLMEMTGTHEEIDTTMANLREAGILSNSARSEVAAPPPAPFGPATGGAAAEPSGHQQSTTRSDG